MDFARKALYDKIDSQWEDFGIPKVELDNIDNICTDFSTDFPTKRSKKVRNRATRRKATAKKKARNKRLAKAKGFNLNLCSRPDKNGSHSPLSNVYSSKKFYDTIKGTEQNKVSARELEEHFKFSIKDKEKEFKNRCEYYKGTHNTTLEDLVKEYLSIRYNAGRLIVSDPFVWYNSYEDILSKCWTDYEKERDKLCETIRLMKRKENAISPLKEIVSVCGIYSLGICKRKLPDNFNFYNLESELYVRMIDGDYIFYAQYVDNTNKGSEIKMLPLFYVDKWYIPRENVETVIMRICDIYTDIWYKYNF